MGEETSWFDFIPGLHGLKQVAAHFLGRETPEQGFYFRWQMFGDSHFTLSHVYFALVVLVIAIIGGITYKRAVSGHDGKLGDDEVVPPPSFNLRNVFEMFTEAVMSIATSVMGEKNARRFLPLVGTLGLFIFVSNVMSLIPGCLPPTANLRTNLALALSVFALTHYFGVRAHGAAYFKHFLGPLWWLTPLMLPIEIVGHVARPVSLSMRLLGNIFADHKVVGAFFLLIPLLVPVPFLILGVLVSIIQTLVFCLLTMVYIQGAVAHEEM